MRYTYRAHDLKCLRPTATRPGEEGIVVQELLGASWHLLFMCWECFVESHVLLDSSLQCNGFYVNGSREFDVLSARYVIWSLIRAWSETGRNFRWFLARSVVLSGFMCKHLLFLEVVQMINAKIRALSTIAIHLPMCTMSVLACQWIIYQVGFENQPGWAQGH